MSNPWDAVLPSVVTAVLTTLETLGLTSGIRGLWHRHERRKIVFVLAQGSRTTWRFRNTSGKAMYRISHNVFPGDGGVRRDKFDDAIQNTAGALASARSCT